MLGLIPSPWLILAIGASIIAAWGGGYWKGHADADRSAEVASLHAVLAQTLAAKAEMQRQARVAIDIASDATERHLRAEKAAADLQAEIEEFARERASHVNPSCAFGQRDVERLRQLGAPGPGHNAPLPPARPSDFR